MWEKYRLHDDTSKWKYPRREIFEIIINRKSKDSNGLYSSIMEEVKAELKEDAQKFILTECQAKYENLFKTSFFSM